MGLILKDGDGTVHRFAKQEDGSYKSPAGVFITLSQREDGKYTAHRSDDIDYLFNESMRLRSSANRTETSCCLNTMKEGGLSR